MKDSDPPALGWKDTGSGGGSDSPKDIPPECIEAELEKILKSKAFVHSERVSRLLRFTVEQTIRGQAGQFKEYLLGVEVFHKGESFDPRVDPAVRVEAHRLRSRLKSYYETEGRDDPIRIDLPKGSYTPVFRRRLLKAWRPARIWPRIRFRSRREALAVAAGVLVAAVTISWLAMTWRNRGVPVLRAQPPSIAVLPFADLSLQQDQEYFCDGITDELINTLAKVERLRVVSRTSVFQFKGKASDIRKIGEQLNANTILEGSVRKAGNKLRITAQLIKVADGYHLWSGTYEREIKDVFVIQEEISRAIVSALRVQLAGPVEGPLIEEHPRNLEAFNLYLKGRFHWNKRTEDGLKKAIEYFEQAISQERDYAAAYAGLADANALLASYGVLPPKEVMPKAGASALRALEIDRTNAQAYASLGFVRSFYEWDWPAAELAYRRAIELNPGYATAHHWYSGCLRAMGRLDEAMDEIRRAQELDPLSVAIGRDLGRVFEADRQHDRAIEQYRKVLEMDPGFPSGYLHLGMAYEQKFMYREALAAFEKAGGLRGANPLTLGALGHCYAVSGNRLEAEKLLGQLEELSRRRYVSPVSRALIHLGLGETARVFEWLDKAYEVHDPWLAWLKVDPIFDPLRTDPRFISMVKRIGLNGSAKGRS